MKSFLDRPAILLLLGVLAVLGAVGLGFHAGDAIDGYRAIGSSDVTTVDGQLHGFYVHRSRDRGWHWSVDIGADRREISVHRPDNGALAEHNDEPVRVELNDGDVVAVRLGDGALVRTTAGSAYGIVRDVVGGLMLLCLAAVSGATAWVLARVRGGWWRRGAPGELRRGPVPRPLANLVGAAVAVGFLLLCFFVPYSLGLVWWGSVLVPAAVVALLLALGRVASRRRSAGRAKAAYDDLGRLSPPRV